jgi:type II secretory pathway predicted ATPase ExeA
MTDFVQLTGEVGAGKPTICRALLEHLGPNYATALILNPDQPTASFSYSSSLPFPRDSPLRPL